MRFLIIFKDSTSANISANDAKVARQEADKIKPVHRVHPYIGAKK